MNRIYCRVLVCILFISAIQTHASADMGEEGRRIILADASVGVSEGRLHQLDQGLKKYRGNVEFCSPISPNDPCAPVTLVPTGEEFYEQLTDSVLEQLVKDVTYVPLLEKLSAPQIALLEVAVDQQERLPGVIMKVTDLLNRRFYSLYRSLPDVFKHPSLFDVTHPHEEIFLIGPMLKDFRLLFEGQAERI